MGKTKISSVVPALSVHEKAVIEGVFRIKNLCLFWHGPFSNWHKNNFEIDGVKYTSTEQHMMAMKARVFGDVASEKAIMSTQNVKQQKALGRKVENFNARVWNDCCQFWVYVGNLAKFSQNQYLKSLLLSTENSIIAEASPVDSVWGIGLASSDARSWDVKTWQGTNYLGNVLMLVRQTLQQFSSVTFTSLRHLTTIDLPSEQFSKIIQNLNIPCDITVFPPIFSHSPPALSHSSSELFRTGEENSKFPSSSPSSSTSFSTSTVSSVGAVAYHLSSSSAPTPHSTPVSEEELYSFPNPNSFTRSPVRTRSKQLSVELTNDVPLHIDTPPLFSPKFKRQKSQ